MLPLPRVPLRVAAKAPIVGRPTVPGHTSAGGIILRAHAMAEGTGTGTTPPGAVERDAAALYHSLLAIPA